MSQSTPPNDDSKSNQDQLRDSSLIQPQYTYPSLLAYPRAAYDFIQLPNSGIGDANEISALSGSPDKAENPSTSVSSVGDQGAVGPRKDNQSPNTPEAPGSITPTSQANMLNNARDVRIGDQAVFNNMAIRCGDNNLLIIPVIIAFICLSIFLLFPGVHHHSPTGNPSTDIFPPLNYTNGHGAMNGLGRLEPFVSHGAINGSNVQDPTRQVHPGTRERVLSQIKAWIDNPNATKHILWLHGPAGVGKSTIAQTITQSYTTEKIPANFFFYHADSERNDGNRLFTTLAWQFTSSIPAIKPHIARSLIEQPDLPRKDVKTQFQELIVRPFEALSNDMRPPHLSNMVVVIDGVDECVNPRLQERFLEVIGNIATNTHVPLRFLISSRPEAHINDTINRFERHTLLIDLAEHAEADHDIEKYLKDQFADIAKRQGIDSTMWPGEKIIPDLVYKSSGQFIYASTVIGFVRDEEYIAQSQLDIILGLKSRTTQPFAELDRLYIEILERQFDQEVLKTFFALLVARHRHQPSYWRLPPLSCWVPPPLSVLSHVHDTCNFLPFSCSYSHLRPSYGILMDMSEEELHRKLRKMRSLLKFTPDGIDLHHRSFLEFLRDPSRSSQYNISIECAVKQHLVLVIASIVRAAEQAFDQPNYHLPISHDVLKYIGYDRERYTEYDVEDIPGNDLREILRPLLKYQDRLLNLPNIVPRNECTVFHIVNMFLSDYWPEQDAVIRLEPVQSLLEALLGHLRSLKGTLDLMITLLSVKPEVVAMKVHSWSEAQNLMDLTYLVVHVTYLPTSLARKAVQLAFEIYTRVPVLPRFIDSGKTSNPYFMLEGCKSCELETFFQLLLIDSFLDHRYILAPVTIDNRHCGTHIIETIFVERDKDESPIDGWRTSTDPSYKEMMFIILNLARTIQYLHSMGFVLSDRIRLDDIYVNSKFRVRISTTELVWLVHGHSLQEVGQRHESDIYTFGSVFFMMYFGTESCCAIRTSLMSLCRPEPSIPQHVWWLIERCLSTKGKPSIDEVVQEMEYFWKVGS